MAKAAKKHFRRKKTIATPTPSLSVEKPSSPSLQDEEVEAEEIIEKGAPARKRGKGKDIAILVSTQKAQNIEKMAFRPLTRAKHFDFESLKTKGWNLREFTDHQGWLGFVSTQEPTFDKLVK